jgi:hypothetical protein
VAKGDAVNSGDGNASRDAQRVQAAAGPRREGMPSPFARIAQLPDHPVRVREEVAMNLKVIRLENVRLTTRSSVTGEG